MRLLIAAIGKLKQGPERDLFAHYLGRAEAVGRKLHLSPLDSIEIAEAKGSTPQARMEAEAEALLAKRPPSYKLICLDPGGDRSRQRSLCRLLAKFRDGGAPEACVHRRRRRRPRRLTALFKADLALSLGPMTLPHGLARIVLAEQIYRAATILAGHPYHRA